MSRKNKLSSEVRHQFYLKHWRKIRAQRKTIYEADRQKVLDANKAWRIKNPEKLRSYYNTRRHTDVQFRLLTNLRHRFYNLFSRKTKLATARSLIGCSTEELKSHLESKFTEGMSWETYGRKGWHIDHIIPCSSFNLSSIEDQKRCFHYSNLQPLWWSDNLKKHAKYGTV